MEEMKSRHVPFCVLRFAFFISWSIGDESHSNHHAIHNQKYIHGYFAFNDKKIFIISSSSKD
jgi:hypothetical protein